MLGVRARTLLLAFVGGSTDAVSFALLFNIFTAHLSGDTTHLAVDLGQGTLNADALGRFVVLVMFVIGLVVGVFVVAASGNRTDRVATMEIALLGVALALGVLGDHAGVIGPSSATFFVLVGVLALAMGLQNGFLRRIAGTGVHTTFVTGMLTKMAEDAVTAWKDRTDTAARKRVVIHGGIWVGYFAGGVAGAAFALVWGFWTLVIPIAGLAVVLAAGGLRQGLGPPMAE